MRDKRCETCAAWQEVNSDRPGNRIGLCRRGPPVVLPPPRRLDTDMWSTNIQPSFGWPWSRQYDWCIEGWVPIPGNPDEQPPVQSISS